MPEPVARFRAVTKRYGPVVAVSEVDLDLLPGEVHVVAGENGAGKSTLMKLLAQVEAADAGQIDVDSVPMTFSGPRAAQRLGVAMVHQELALARDLTVAENLFLGREPMRAGLIDRRRQTRESVELLGRVGLELDTGRVVRGLSVAQQQLVEIAKALAIDAKVVIMDEPTATLNDAEVDHLMRVIANLRSHGIAVLYISHRLEEIFRIADRVTVMRDGRVVETRSRRDLDERTLVRLMVGREIEQLYPTVTSRPGNVVLRVIELADPGRLGPISFEARAGEILASQGWSARAVPSCSERSTARTRRAGGKSRLTVDAGGSRVPRTDSPPASATCPRTARATGSRSTCGSATTSRWPACRRCSACCGWEKSAVGRIAAGRSSTSVRRP